MHNGLHNMLPFFKKIKQRKVTSERCYEKKPAGWLTSIPKMYIETRFRPRASMNKRTRIKSQLSLTRGKSLTLIQVHSNSSKGDCGVAAPKRSV
jgi:hypothetical protein